MDRQQEFVLRTLEERDIRFVRLWFTDVLGTSSRSRSRRPSWSGAFEEGIGFDGSAIEGFARAYESRHDRQAGPGARSRCFPCEGGAAATRPDVLRHPACPTARRPGPTRGYVLRRALAKAADKGFTFYTHPEIEFFLLKDRPERRRGAAAGRHRRLLRP